MSRHSIAKRSATVSGALTSVQQGSLIADIPEPESTIEDVLTDVMHQLGITETLVYERREVEIAQIRIPHANRMRGVNRYTRNIEMVGVLHDPAVIAIPGTQEYETIFGRHRICGAREAGEAIIWVRVYTQLNPKVKAFLRLSEQRRRTTSWVDELEQVIEVIDEGCGLSEKAIAWSLGVPLPTLRFYFKVAKLPFMLRERVLAGEVTIATARRMLRLSTEQLAALDAVAVSDAPLDEAFIKHLLQQRVTDGLQQVPLAAAWTDLPVVPLPASDSVAEAARELLGTLDRLLPQFNGMALGNTARVQMSGRIFTQELTAWLCAAVAMQEGGIA